MPEPRRKVSAVLRLPARASVTRWFLFAQGKEHCFKEEIARGLFPASRYTCGCKECSPQAYREYHQDARSRPLPHEAEPAIR